MTETLEQPQPDYLTVAEAAELARCDQRTIRRAFWSGALRAFRPAHRVLLRESDVRQWIESRPVRARASQSPRRQAKRRRAAAGSADDLRAMDPDLRVAR